MPPAAKLGSGAPWEASSMRTADDDAKTLNDLLSCALPRVASLPTPREKMRRHVEIAWRRILGSRTSRSND